MERTSDSINPSHIVLLILCQFGLFKDLNFSLFLAASPRQARLNGSLDRNCSVEYNKANRTLIIPNRALDPKYFNVIAPNINVNPRLRTWTNILDAMDTPAA